MDNVIENIVLDNIPFNLDPDLLAGLLRVKKGSEGFNILDRLIGEALATGRPKAIYRPAFIESRGDDYVVVDGVTLTSRVMAVNVEDVNRVFPFVATCGTELDKWARSFDDTLERFMAEMIMGMGLGAAIAALDKNIHQVYRPGKISHMSPGSLDDWPLTEQKALFDILGDVSGSIDVELTDSFFMTPQKTVSGLRFPGETSFESCMLCPREECPGRRAPYDKDLYDKKYRRNGVGHD